MSIENKVITCMNGMFYVKSQESGTAVLQPVNMDGSLGEEIRYALNFRYRVTPHKIESVVKVVFND